MHQSPGNPGNWNCSYKYVFHFTRWLEGHLASFPGFRLDWDTPTFICRRFLSRRNPSQVVSCGVSTQAAVSVPKRHIFFGRLISHHNSIVCSFHHDSIVSGKPLSLPAPTSTTSPKITNHCVLWDEMHMSMILGHLHLHLHHHHHQQQHQP